MTLPDEEPKDPGPDPFENRMTDEFRYCFWLRMGRPDIAERFGPFMD